MGIGLIIIIIQLHPLFGADGYSSPLVAIKHLNTIFPEMNVADMTLGIVTLLIVFFFPKRLSSKLPSPLAALIFCTAVSVLTDMDVTTIGHIPS